MEFTPGEDPVKIVAVTAEDFGYDINVAHKAVSVLERTDGNFERSSTAGKMLSNSIACYRELIHERKGQSMQQTSLLSYFKKLLQPLQPLAVTNIEARPSTSKKVTIP